MASAARGVPGLVLASAVLCTPASAFAALGAPGAAALAKQGATPPKADAPGQPGLRSMATAGATYALCTLAAAAGAKRLARRRPVTTTRVLGKPIQVADGQADPVTTVPGSDAETNGVWDPLGFGQVASAAGSFCGSSAQPGERAAKTVAHYTTEKILPNFQWLKTGVKTSDLAPTELRALNMAGVDVLVGKNQSGGLFCVGNLCPHLGTPMSEGADVIGDVIVCPLHGSSFKTTTGELIDWCPSPPILGPLTGLVIEKKALAVFEAKTSFFSDDIEVKVDVNARRAYEADYWKGLLDAQGKVDGTYY